MEWVEVSAKSVELAVAAALEELGITEEQAAVEVIQEPERGFLGFGGTEAIVRVRQAPKPRRRRRSRKGRAEQRADDGQRGKGGARRPDRAKAKPEPKKESRGGRPDKKNRQGQRMTEHKQRSEPSEESKAEVDMSQQAAVLEAFAGGLIEAFGLEGNTATRIEDGVIYVDITGEQTEALVGTRGAILQAILDLMKIVVQRRTHHRARIRLDIAGYAERRREALMIYSKRLSEQVLADGQEVMLEPMHPGDRKVVHDAVAEIEGVRSWSEGEEPHRSVILGLAPGFEATGSSDDSEE